ncbi:MAG: VapC toxin family PIN domain ribonuclease [Actinomycetia bacterium]|nr:VapC toxin family PIN domain ribonuclease [Actinomycetes bacterium]
MTRALLDVNVLLSLLDGAHVDHQRARAWLTDEISHGWASCAITQNGFVRIVSQPRYPNPVSPRAALDRLAGATDTSHHTYWSCSVSIVDAAAIDRTQLHGSRQVTDAYLLALATANEGRFVTFDRTIPFGAVPDASESNLVVL